MGDELVWVKSTSIDGHGYRWRSCTQSLLWMLGAFASIAFCAIGGPSSAAPRTYSYTIEHPSYGDIGVYSDTIDESDGMRRVTTRLRVAIKVLGIVVYREDADRTEIWQGDRLMSFNGLTTVNGVPKVVRGEARGNGFVITSPSGTVVAPANIYPSSPWSVNLPKPDSLLSTDDGHVTHASVSNEGMSIVSINNFKISLRHFVVHSDNWQEVWSDPSGVPVRFRTERRGALLDFVLAPESFSALIASQH